MEKCVLDILVNEMLSQGACLQEILERAVVLSRESFHRLGRTEKMLDSLFGSDEFRRDSIDPLLDKERQIEAIQDRIRCGGPLRTSDRDSLNSLLARRIQEFRQLQNDFPWSTLEPTAHRLVSNYMGERRTYLQTGDVDRIRRAVEEAHRALAA